MSKLETPLTRWYWRRVGGLLIEEYPLIERGPEHGARLLDGLIIQGEPDQVLTRRPWDLEGRDVIVVQTKARRLNLPLMGQCVFSLQLVRQLGPRSARAVAICTADDAILRPLLEGYEGCSVVIPPASALTEDPL